VPAPSVSIVVPVLNGERYIRDNVRTLADWLAKQPGEREIVIVDDGSRDGTWNEVERALDDGHNGHSGGVVRRALRNPENRGKGHAVRRGLLAARGTHRAFVDADLTYPVDNLGAIFEALARGADVAIGSRVRPGSRYVMAPAVFRRLYTRHAMGRVFNWVTRKTLLGDVFDTQAGLKGMSARAAERILPLLTLDRFSFDVELLYLARRHRLRVEEVPVTCVWCDEPSTLELAGDGLSMLLDLARIRWRAANGHYDLDVSEAPSSGSERSEARPGANEPPGS
jgi:glycosyltransferase involved in cell wall biosynthesis